MPKQRELDGFGRARNGVIETLIEQYLRAKDDAKLANEVARCAADAMLEGMLRQDVDVYEYIDGEQAWVFVREDKPRIVAQRIKTRQHDDD